MNGANESVARVAPTVRARPHRGGRGLSATLADAALVGVSEAHGHLGFHAAIDLKRELEREDLVRAVAATVKDFPVLGCIYERRLWRDRWVPWRHGDAAMVLDARPGTRVPDGPALEAETRPWVERSLDPTERPPLRVVRIARPRGVRLILSLAHTAVDGGGAMAVAQVLASRLAGLEPALPVETRRDVGLSMEAVRWYRFPVLAAAVAVSTLAPLRIARLAPRDRPFATVPSGAACWRQIVLEADEVQALKRACRARGASLNDALIAALARVAAGRTAGRRVAITYTMDLRRNLATPRLVAANLSGILTAFVPREHVGDLASTAGAVARITAGHARALTGLAYLAGPATALAVAPHAIVRRLTHALSGVFVRLPVSRALMLTNVGVIDGGLGGLEADVEHLEIVGPNLENVGIPALVAAGFRGRLLLHVYGAPGLSPESLDEYVDELRQALRV